MVSHQNPANMVCMVRFTGKLVAASLSFATGPFIRNVAAGGAFNGTLACNLDAKSKATYS